MKKLLLLVLASVFAFSTNAQGFKIGAKAGYGMSGYITNYDVPDGFKMSKGMNFGLVAELNAGPADVRIDVTYIQLGSDFDSRNNADDNWFFSGTDADMYYKQDINYLNFALNAKKSFGPVYAYAGPYVSIALNSKETRTWKGQAIIDPGGLNIPLTPGPGTGTRDIFDNVKEVDNSIAFSDENNGGGAGKLYNKFDYGFNIGLGGTYKGVFIEAFAGIGLMNFLNEDSDEYQEITDDAYDFNTSEIDLGPASQWFPLLKYAKGDEAEENPTQNNLFFGFSIGYLFGF